jgi:ABC-type antimicrobial peptide transport system permease subunit
LSRAGGLRQPQLVAAQCPGDDAGDESPLGKNIRINNVKMTIRGVLASKGASVGGFDQDDCVFAPWTTIKYRVSGQRQTVADALVTSSASQVNSLSQLYPGQQLQLYPQKSAAQVADTPHMIRFPDINDIFISAETREDIQPVIRQATQILRERHRLRDGDPDDFRIRNYTEIADSLASTSRLMTNLLLCVALISLVVGGVGIMNIMLVSVTERTREIGLRMAVGARTRDILRQFLLEAVLLCLAGGVTGIALGRGASIAMTRLLGWPTSFSLAGTVAAVVVSVSVGIAFGFYPAWRASRLNPIEALGHE